jgi:hypothetical protein
VRARMSLTSAELPRVELHREPAGGPLLMRPAVEVDALVKIDGLRLDAEDDPWPVGIVLGHGEAIRAHERMFAGSGGVRLRVCPAPDRTRSPQPLDAARALALRQVERHEEIELAQTCTRSCSRP